MSLLVKPAANRIMEFSLMVPFSVAQVFLPHCQKKYVKATVSQ